MGGIKKAIKKIGNAFGFGGTSQPEYQQIDPAPQTVVNSDVSADTGNGDNRRRKRGFASTIVNQGMMSGIDFINGRNKLG